MKKRFSEEQIIGFPISRPDARFSAGIGIESEVKLIGEFAACLPPADGDALCAVAVRCKTAAIARSAFSPKMWVPVIAALVTCRGTPARS